MQNKHGHEFLELHESSMQTRHAQSNKEHSVSHCVCLKCNRSTAGGCKAKALRLLKQHTNRKEDELTHGMSISLLVNDTGTADGFSQSFHPKDMELFSKQRIVEGPAC